MRRLFTRGLLRGIDLLRGYALWRGTRGEHRGLSVAMHRCAPAHRDACLSKLYAAIDLVATHDPASLAEMQDRFALVAVWPGVAPDLASYLHAKRLCEVNCEYLERESTEPARVAMTLVHELKHARLLEKDDPLRPMSRSQAEWLCIGAEIAFARKVPGTEHLVAAARKRLDRRPEFYSPRADAARTLEGLRKQDLPGWLIRFFERLHARRFARGRREPGAREPGS